MNVKRDIKLYSSEENKPILTWLFSKYHWQSQWTFVAKCSYIGTYPNAHTVWEPTKEGKLLYKYRDELGE